MIHAVRHRKSLFSVEEVKRITYSCRTYAEIKPRFYKSRTCVLIKATQPFERLNLDFQGPLISKTRNQYILPVVDEYSRFSLAFPRSDISATAIIQCLCSLFAVFWVPAYIHSDREASFMSKQLRQFLQERGVAVSQTTLYNSKGNGQYERHNGIIWKTVQLVASNNGYSIANWENFIPVALYAKRSLLCTATNAPDTTSNDTVFVGASSDTSDGPTPKSLTDEGLSLEKRVHPGIDSGAERSAPLRRKHFRARYFRAHRQARTEEPNCLSTPTLNHGLPRRSLRVRRSLDI